MAEYLIVCVNRSGSDPKHSHITEVGIQPLAGGPTQVKPVKSIRRDIKLGVNRYFSTDPSGRRVRVRRYKCDCGTKTIRTKRDDIGDNNLSVKAPCIQLPSANAPK